MRTPLTAQPLNSSLLVVDLCINHLLPDLPVLQLIMCVRCKLCPLFKSLGKCRNLLLQLQLAACTCLQASILAAALGLIGAITAVCSAPSLQNQDLQCSQTQHSAVCNQPQLISKSTLTHRKCHRPRKRLRGAWPRGRHCGSITCHCSRQGCLQRPKFQLKINGWTVRGV